MKPTTIECPICGEPCGKEYPADDIDPGFREGRGEEFVSDDGAWHCCKECLETTTESAAL